MFFEFAVAKPVRHQLMNRRTIPGLEPSPKSYAPSVRVYELGEQLFRDLGLTERSDNDIWEAMIAGMINQQLAGDRWHAVVGAAGPANDIWPMVSAFP